MYNLEQQQFLYNIMAASYIAYNINTNLNTENTIFIEKTYLRENINLLAAPAAPV